MRFTATIMPAMTGLAMLLLTASPSAAQSPSPPAGLEIVTEGFPRVVNMRNESRLATNYFPANYNFFRSLDGVVMKPLNEEMPPTAGGNRPGWLDGYAASNPTKLYLAHFNHYAWQPVLMQEVSLFPGHYFYREATVPTQDIQPSDTNIPIAHVSRILYVSQGTNIFNPHAIIVRTDANGERLWDQAEYIKILAVDTNTSVLTVQRNFMPWAPTPLPTWPADGHTQIAAAITEYDLDGLGGKFSINYSTNCPTDAQGRTATDVVLDYLAKEFSPTGRCARAHGIAFDAPFERPFSASKFLPDLNNNGSGADDAAENYESYRLGYYMFLKRLRERMGTNFIMTADARSETQRAVSLLNGMESEGFPYHVKDPYLTYWSSSFNQFAYWKRALTLPFDANYAHLKDTSGAFPVEADRPKNLTRLVLGGIVCNGAIATAAFLPNPTYAAFPTNLWDEGTRGVDMVHNWLGPPLGGIVRLATQTPDLFNGEGISLTSAFISQFNSPDATITKVGDYLRFRHNGTPQSDDELDVNFVINKSLFTNRTGDLLLRFEIEADPRPGYEIFGDVPRNVFVRIYNSGINTSNTAAELFAYAGAVPFAEVTFYYRDALPLVPDQNLRFTFRFEGLGDVRIRNITLHNAPDALLREFRHGVVLCNPSLQPFTFDLASLLPGRSFRRIRGQFDPVVNDGSIVTDPAAVEVPVRDALFLIKDPLSITTTSPLPEGVVSAAYSVALTATGGTPPYLWSLAGGSLPAGLLLTTNGVITGTPTAYGEFNVSIQVSDAAGTAVTNSFSLIIQGMTFQRWQNDNFTPEELADPAISGATADPDGDGLPNLLEYALHRQPKSPDAAGVTVASVMEHDGQRYLTLTYRRRIGLADLTFAPEASSDLTAWNSAECIVVSVTDDGNGLTETVVVRDTYPMAETPKRFMRLRVTQ